MGLNLSRWPALDENLTFRGLLEGDFGQLQKKPKLWGKAATGGRGISVVV
jgi:hypothetical protein